MHQPAKGGAGAETASGNKASLDRTERAAGLVPIVTWWVALCGSLLPQGGKGRASHCVRDAPALCAPKAHGVMRNSRVHTGLSDHDSPNPPAKNGRDPGFF